MLFSKKNNKKQMKVMMAALHLSQVT